MDVKDSDCGSVAQWFQERVDFAVKPPPVGQTSAIVSPRRTFRLNSASTGLPAS